MYLAAGGALREYIDTMRYASGYAWQGGPGNPPDGPTLRSTFDAVRLAFWNWALSRIVLTLPALAAGFSGAFILRERRIQQLVLFAVLAYVGIAVQAKFFWYHYGYMVPLMALIDGWAWDRLLRALRPRLPPLIATLTAGVIAAGLLFGSPQVWDNGEGAWRAYVRHARQHEALETYYATLPGYAAERTVGRYVRDRTQPGDPIYVWGFDPQIYLLAEREPASRFLLSFPLMSDWAPRRWQRVFIDELEARRPAYVIVQRGQAGNWIVGHNIDMADYIGWFPAFQQWLDATCELETEVIANIMYRCRR